MTKAESKWMSRANVAKSEQKNSQSRTKIVRAEQVMVDQTWSEHNRTAAEQKRIESCRVDQTWPE